MLLTMITMMIMVTIMMAMMFCGGRAVSAWEERRYILWEGAMCG